MDIDLTSVIISIVAFSFFIVLIVIDQLKNKKESGNEEESTQS